MRSPNGASSVIAELNCVPWVLRPILRKSSIGDAHVAASGGSSDERHEEEMVSGAHGATLAC